MRFPASCKIHNACSTDNKGRAYQLNAVFVDRSDPSAPKLVATDGRILAIVPARLQNDEDTIADNPSVRFLPAEALKAATTGAKPYHEVQLQIVSGPITVTSPKGKQTIHPAVADQDPSRFPKHTALIPKEPAKATIRLNPALLLDLAKAIGAEDGITLEIVDPKLPIRVFQSKAGYTTKPHGVIMPIALED